MVLRMQDNKPAPDRLITEEGRIERGQINDAEKSDRAGSKEWRKSSSELTGVHGAGGSGADKVEEGDGAGGVEADPAGGDGEGEDVDRLRRLRRELDLRHNVPLRLLLTVRRRRQVRPKHHRKQRQSSCPPIVAETQTL